MNKFKKNQFVVYAIVLMLIVAGYLNYIENDKTVPISANTQNNTNIGDATLVSNNENSSNDEQQTNNEENESNLNSNDKNNQEQNNENTQETNGTNVKTDDNYFANSKIEREKMYSQMLETYQKMLENTSISEEQKLVASKEITNINNTRNSIMICENLMAIKGFEESVILSNGESINVVVKADSLKEEEIAQIQNIITREMSTQIENIHIMKK